MGLYGAAMAAPWQTAMPWPYAMKAHGRMPWRPMAHGKAMMAHGRAMALPWEDQIIYVCV